MRVLCGQSPIINLRDAHTELSKTIHVVFFFFFAFALRKLSLHTEVIVAQVVRRSRDKIRKLKSKFWHIFFRMYFPIACCLYFSVADSHQVLNHLCASYCFPLCVVFKHSLCCLLSVCTDICNNNQLMQWNAEWFWLSRRSSQLFKFEFKEFQTNMSFCLRDTWEIFQGYSWKVWKQKQTWMATGTETCPRKMYSLPSTVLVFSKLQLY